MSYFDLLVIFILDIGVPFVALMMWLFGGGLMPKVMLEMEMPKSCSDCLFPHIEAHYHKKVWAKTFHLCPFVDEYVDGCMQRRHPECPLQEVKE